MSVKFDDDVVKFVNDYRANNLTRIMNANKIMSFNETVNQLIRLYRLTIAEDRLKDIEVKTK